MSAEHGQFIQFPLCALASTRPFRELLGDVWGYGVVKFIIATHQDVEDAHSLRYHVAKIKEDAMNLARGVIGFDGGDLGAYLGGYDRIEMCRNRWESTVGPTCWARLRRDLYFDARDGDPTEEEMRVLIGLYSMIGDKAYAKVGWPMIQARAAGGMKPGFSRADGLCGPLYNRSKIDRRCAELITRGLVHSFTFNRGERFWSHRLTAIEIAAAVGQRKAKRIEKLQQQRAINEAASREICAKRDALTPDRHLLTCSDRAQDVCSETTDCALGGRGMSTGVSTTMGRQVRTLIETY